MCLLFFVPNSSFSFSFRLELNQMINKWNFKLTHEINVNDSVKRTIPEQRKKKRSGMRPSERVHTHTTCDFIFIYLGFGFVI